MSRNTGNKSAAPRKSGNPLLTGILVGMVIGVGMAAGLAWYIMKSPSPFVQKEPVIAKPPVDIAKPVAPAGNATPNVPAAASGVVDGKPRFEFYKVLTDKQDAAVAAPARPLRAVPRTGPALTIATPVPAAAPAPPPPAPPSELSSADPLARHRALEGLSRPAHAAAALPLLADDLGFVRRAAAAPLRRLKVPGTVPALLALHSRQTHLKSGA